MKRRLLSASLLFLCGFPFTVDAGARQAKEKTAAPALNRVFLGWVDLVPDDWQLHGFSSKAEWSETVDALNGFFQRSCTSKWLADRTVTGAKSINDVDATGHDVLIKFSDVRIDYDHYELYLSIHFINPKDNSEFRVIRTSPYGVNKFGFTRYLRASLESVAKRVSSECPQYVPEGPTRVSVFAVPAAGVASSEESTVEAAVNLVRGRLKAGGVSVVDKSTAADLSIEVREVAPTNLKTRGDSTVSFRAQVTSGGEGITVKPALVDSGGEKDMEDAARTLATQLLVMIGRYRATGILR